MTKVYARHLDHNHLANHRGECGGERRIPEPQVLRPFHRIEAFSIAEAADLAGKSPRTVREWCHFHDIGRRIGGQWAVSKVALAIWLDGDKPALEAYLAGDRRSPTVTEYFARCGVPLPKRGINGLAAIRETGLSEYGS